MLAALNRGFLVFQPKSCLSAQVRVRLRAGNPVSKSDNLKPGALAEFTKAMENEILPWLRKQKGFLGVITLAVPSGREVLAISFWDQKENAQAYHSTGYPQVLKILGKLIEGTPHVRTFDVVSATLEKVAPRLAA